MSISMHIENLDKFYKRVLKILSENEKIMTDERTDGRTKERNDRQPKSYIATPPLFQSGSIIMSICFQDIERKLNFGVNQGAVTLVQMGEK